MFILWITVFSIAAIFALAQSCALALQTWEHRRFCRSSIRDVVRHDPRGKVVVFAPCKGTDVDQEGNLRALMSQDYKNYEVRFVVESLADPACAAIRRVMAQCPNVPARIVCADIAVDSGQKVHNLRVATGDLPGDCEYLAFVDSDAQPRPDWLRMLVARLDGRPLGVATGHRWFAPKRATLPNLVVYSINCAMMALLDRTGRKLIWGGSWAIRRDLFESVGLRREWRGTLSDDFVARRVLLQAGEPIRFEPATVVASPLELGFGEMFSFLRRQYMISRFYSPRWWQFGLLAVTASALAWLVLGAAAATALMAGVPSPRAALAALGAVYLIGIFRGIMRQSLVRIYFPQDALRFRAAQWFDLFAGPVPTLVNWVAMLSSLVGDRIVWRGVAYRMLPGGRIDFEAAREDQTGDPAVKTPRELRQAA